MVVQHVPRAHDDAIGRRALHGVVPLADLAQPQRIVERERMRHAGLVVLGRDHPDVVGQSLRDLLADFQARRVDAVVVGDKDAHYFFSIFLMPPIYGASASGTTMEPSACW